MSDILEKEEVEYLSNVIKSARTLPKSLQKIGTSEVRWWEGKAGDAVVMASGGTLAERIFVENIVKDQLSAFGYKRASFHFAAPALTQTPDGGEAISGRPENEKPKRKNPYTPGWYRYKSGDVIILEKDVKGITEGGQNAEGIGKEVTVPAGSVGYVYEQDKSGRIQITFPLDGGANTPTHIYCKDVKPNEVVPGSNKYKLDDPMIGQADWESIPEQSPSTDKKYKQKIDRSKDLYENVSRKAERLIQSGSVQILKNGFNVIVADVNGDHGRYRIEIGRDDPDTQSITSWKCECKWDQYAWQRTRQWKKYEGRPCSHVLAAYWQANATPLDRDAEQQEQQKKIIDKEQLGKPSEEQVQPVPGKPAPPLGGEPSLFAEDVGTETGQIPTQIKPLRGLYQLHAPEPPEENLVQKQFIKNRGLEDIEDQGFSFSPEPTRNDSRYYENGIIPESPVERQQRMLEEQALRNEMYSIPGKTQPSPTNPIQMMNTYSSVKESGSWFVNDSGQFVWLELS